VAQISGIKRLALGLSVMGLGFVGALPFRHAPALRPNADDSAQEQITLGGGVALQVPGETSLGSLPGSDAPPTLTVDEQQQPAVEQLLDEPALVKLAPPPRLPDHYQPLFQSDRQRQQDAGHVVSSPYVTARSRKPRRHTIHDGDTLESLAVRYLGDADRATDILEANRQVLSDPEILPIGVQIVIPRGELPPSGQDGGVSAASELEPLPSVGLFRGR
jgi:nucleoid-associated protein YgaU